MRKLSITFFLLAIIVLILHKILGSIIPSQAYLEWYSVWNLFYWWEVFLSLGLLFLSLIHPAKP